MEKNIGMGLKAMKNIGLSLFLLGMLVFLSAGFWTSYQADPKELLSLNASLEKVDGLAEIEGELQFNYAGEIAAWLNTVIEEYNAVQREAQAWDNVVYVNPEELALEWSRQSINPEHPLKKTWAWFVVYGLAIMGGLLMVLAQGLKYKTAGIKHDGIYHKSATNRGWIAYVVFGFLIVFYVVLYFFPSHLSNQIIAWDSFSQALKNAPASRWFLYGTLYGVVMTIMAIRMIFKYLHNRYQIVRTLVVLFFQWAFAFIIPELLLRFNQPYMDFKNAWPLDYDFFFSWNLTQMMEAGTLGWFMLFWGIGLTLIAVPVFVYFFGKRWYCSWVCGCGGLAETLGDPYRQHSDKSLKAWKFERYIVHGVLVFAVLMTSASLYGFFSGDSQVIGIQVNDFQSTYGFLIGSIFSGVIGTGFYPIFGNRVWCRFGCPLAAYLGLVQRFKSRFRITTNGGQCISCGNCSTYCEQGIDVRWYAQRGQNIVRSSCVGCGVCSAVCPRGVLKLENGPEKDRINDNPILIGNDEVRLKN